MDPQPETSPPPESSPPAPAPPGPAARQSPRWLNIAFVAAIGVVVAGVSFAVGRATAPSDLEQLRANLPGSGRTFVGPSQGQQRGQGFPGQGAPGQGGQGGRMGLLGAGSLAIEGTVASIDDDSLTITTASGRTIELSIDTDTSYHTAAAADASVVTTGSKVVVRVQAGDGQGPGFQLDADDVTVVP
jgi:hypothetical protein